MARVHEAFDRRLERPVAIKLLDAGPADEAVRARFMQEAEVAAKFSHPNAVRVYDAGEDDGILFLVMELLEGPSLAGVLADRGPLEVIEATDIASQILAAVGAGHEAGLVHRDIKPSNILFAGDGSAKLADFGIAKSVSALAIPLTATGQVIGTPRYLSPEQVMGRPASPRSDLYAVGVVLFEMLTGSPPFAGDTPLVTALAHQQAPVPRLVARRPDIDEDLAAVVERALAKAPEDRHPDAAAMRDALASPPPATLVARANHRAVRRSPTEGTRPLDVQLTPPAARRRARTRRSLVVQSLALLTAAGLAAAVFTQGGDGDGAGTRRSAQPPITAAPQAGNSATTSTAPMTASTTVTTPPTTAAVATSPAPPAAPPANTGNEGGAPAATPSEQDPPGQAGTEQDPPADSDSEGSPPAHADGDNGDAGGN
jgi:eukaryotic-like serine/threonine-protein kinase